MLLVLHDEVALVGGLDHDLFRFLQVSTVGHGEEDVLPADLVSLGHVADGGIGHYVVGHGDYLVAGPVAEFGVHQLHLAYDVDLVVDLQEVP